MKPLISFVVGLGFFVLPLAAQERRDGKAKEEEKAPPRAVYQHTTTNGRLGKFELDGKRGKADYYFNGQHHQDDLEYTRFARMSDPSLSDPVPGWVYQVVRKGKKESLWFFFAADPIARGGDRYVMSYSTTAPNPDGKQPWTRIFTPGGTTRTPLEKRKAGDGKEQ